MVKIILASTMLVLAACGSDDTASESPEAPAAVAPVKREVAKVDYSKHSGLLLEHMDPEVRPGDDFNAYVNGGWIDATEIPSDKPAYGISTILRDNSQVQVKTIIEKSAAGDFAKGSDEQKVGDLFASFINMQRRNELGVSPLHGEFEKIEALSDYEALAAYFAEANRSGVDMPIQLDQYADFKDPNQYMMYAWQGGLGLADREFYFLEDEKSGDIRAKYVEHIARMFELASLEDGGAAADMIMALETRIAGEHMLKEDTRNYDVNYNKAAIEDLAEVMPNFN